MIFRVNTGVGFVIFVFSLLFIAFTLKSIKQFSDNKNVVAGII